MSHQYVSGEANQQHKIKKQIRDLLDKSQKKFHWLHHKEARDSQSAEEATGISLTRGIKSLIVRGKKSGKNHLICLIGHQKIDWSKLSKILKENCELEKPEAIVKKFKVEIGTIAPFGVFYGMDVYFEKSILECKEVVFSGGTRTDSVCMDAQDLIFFIQPTIASFAKE